MSNLFADAKAFNQPLNSWRTGNVTNVDYMLSSAEAYNQPMSSWQVGSDTATKNTFLKAGCPSFSLCGTSPAPFVAVDGNVGCAVQGWCAKDDGAHKGCVGYTYDPRVPPSTWSMAAVKNMSSLFAGEQSCNPDIDSWQTSAVTDMSYMFSEAKAFNQPLNSSRHFGRMFLLA